MKKVQQQSDQQADLESLTVRIPRMLKERLGSIFGGNASENVRAVLESGMRDVDSLQDKRELITLQRDERAAMSRVLEKGHGELLSRAQLAFLAQRAHQAYQLSDTGIVSRELLLSNLKAFDAVRRLRIECIAEGSLPRDYDPEGLDRYYHGNLGNSGSGTIGETITKRIAEFEDFPYRSHAEFITRCLEVALRDEPILPVDRLNFVLAPYLGNLVKVALRSYYVKAQQPLVVPKTIHNGGSVKYLPGSSSSEVAISPSAIGDDFTLGITLRNRGVVIALNSYVEFCQFDLLARAFESAEWEVKGGKYIFLRTSPKDRDCALRVGSVQIELSGTEYSDLLRRLQEFKAEPKVKSELERLAHIFGEI